MTIAALMCGTAGTYNALFVDTRAIGPNGELRHFDKIHRPFGETFFTCVGDGTLAMVLLKRAWASSKRNRPNLRDRSTVESLFAEIEQAQRTNVLLGHPAQMPAPSPCTTLIVCNRAETFFWKAEYDAAKRSHVIPEKATFLAPGSLTVFRGETVCPFDGFVLPEIAEAEKFTVDQMLHANEQVERAGGDAYPAARTVSGIILPRGTSAPMRRIDPGVPQMPILGLPPDPFA